MEHCFISLYETGEGWSSADVFPGSLFSNHTVYLDNTGICNPCNEQLSATTVLRSVKLKLNGTTLTDTLLNGYNIKRFHVTDIPLSLLSGGTANIEFVNSGFGSDKIVVAGLELSVPDTFNFEGQSQFEFNLEAGSSKYLEISNFNFGSSAPVLYDQVNNLRLTGDVNGAVVRFVIPAIASAGSFILSNTKPALNLYSNSLKGIL